MMNIDLTGQTAVVSGASRIAGGLVPTWQRHGPRGTVVVSVYSSGAIGRLVPDDVAGLVRYVREHTPASA